MNKSRRWKQSAAAHKRLARSTASSSLTSSHYHRFAAIETESRRRVLTPSEKRELYRYAKEYWQNLGRPDFVPREGRSFLKK